MKDKRAIIIKTPKLRKIRNNFRDLWLKATSSKWNNIYDRRRDMLFRSDGSRITISAFSPSELAQFRNLQSQEATLRELASRSICMCVTCGKGEQDMVYNKAYDAWYCTECYGMERLNTQERAKLKIRKLKPCEEKAIQSHSKTFL